MLAKCAACPASCISVVSAVSPEPTALGSASEVKWVTEGWKLPSGLTHAQTGLKTEIGHDIRLQAPVSIR